MSLYSNPERSEMDGPPEEMAGPPESNRKKAWKAWRARLRRREKIQRVADASAERWQRLHDLPTAPQTLEPEAPVQRPLPQPQGLGIMKKEYGELSALPPPRRELAFKAGVFKSMARLIVWIGGTCFFAFGVLQDWLGRRNTQATRARRLKETFLKMGITFIKIGQQLSMRIDLLPKAYTDELEELLSDVPTEFDPEEAIKAIERARGQKKGAPGPIPLAQIFSAFDSKPIGSASVACVYQAILISGERVAVKVRRPNIGPNLAADMRALGWLLRLVEVVCFAPGFFKNLIVELRMMLTEELDFAREARFADLYRRKMRKTKQMSFVSVPRVFFDYSNDEVMVAEFVSGIWLKDILPALEAHDAQALAKLDDIDFDPIILARRIQLIARFNNFENIFFHADLHPANILIRPGNKIVLIDFGSCGSFNMKELNSWRRWFDAQSVDDVGGMVQAALAIIEPLPPIDRDQFGKELESKFWDQLYAIKSKHSEWQERITSRLWYDFLALSRKHHIPMRLNTLRMIRASMLTDTIAIRLDPDQDAYREFRYYERGAGKRAKKRVVKRLRTLTAPRKFIGLEHGVESALKLVNQVQRTVDSLASISIQDVIAKVEYFLTLFFRHLLWIVLTFAVSVFGLAVYRVFNHGFNHGLVHILNGLVHIRNTGTLNWVHLKALFYDVLLSPIWIIIAAAPNAVVLWRLSFRLSERKPWDN
jgi:ubiquinone biosynthesis protein